MADPYVPLVTRFGRGLNRVDAPEAIPEGQARAFTNLRLDGIGRATMRRAAVALSTGYTGELLVCIPYNGAAGVGGVVLTWDSGAQVVKLYTVNGSGGGVAFVADLPGWTAVAARPRVSGAVIHKMVFICDEARNYGLTVYDPANVLGSGSLIFRPTFDFDEDLAFGVAKPRIVLEHMNHLWMFGHGSEAEDRAEHARYSYLGLEFDPHGAGDAGVGGAAGSEQLFDIEDGFGIGKRGIPIVAAASGNGFMVVATSERAGVVFGSDWENWSFDWFDGQRGALASRGMIEGDGIVYWLSKLGFASFSGGNRPEDITRNVRPVLAEMNFTTCFGAHSPQEHQVRWYYARNSDSDTRPDRWIGWDYERKEWLSDVLGYRVNGPGQLLPDGTEAPVGAPTNLFHVRYTDRATAFWDPGDATPGTKTRVYLAPDVAGAPGAYVFEPPELDGSFIGHTHTGLASGTTYWTKVEHVRNGQTSAPLEGSFTTL